MSTAPDPRVWQAVEALWEVAEAEQVADPERFLAARPALEPAVVELFRRLWAQRSEDAQGASTGVTQLLAQQVGGHSEARYRQGQCIGRYRLLRQLGEGGAGVVYLAESVEADLRHQVAIKLLHERLDDNDPLQRSVQQERRLLARLVHPCITRYHDSGVTEDGLSYVVVEYVDGLPITRHVREQGCSAVVTLRLFAQTARAVHYAHQNLVVHRDIKPSNVLVDSRHDLPKLLDFGIARDLEGRGADEHTELFAHTPAYASPEQLAGEASIGTPTDLYSLGLLLHEIVLGRLPVPPATRHPATRLAQLRQLPAVRLPDSHEDALPLTGLHRGQLRDLAAVISRLLSFHPEDRYPSAEALAVDIDRILDDQPIQSTHHALRRRLWRWLRRNRALATISVAGLLLAIGAAGIYVAQSQDLARQAVRLSSVRALLSDLLTRPDPLRRGASVTLLETVESMLPQLDAPDLDADVRSEIQGILGRTLLRLGRVEQATALLQQAHAHVLLARPDSPERRSLEASLALAALEAGQYVDAREQALALVAALRQDHGAEALPLARALRILATARIHADNDLPGAQADARSALALLEAAGNPDVSEAATTRSVLALALSLAGELDEAATLQQAVLDDVQSREGADAALTFDPRNNL
ncbi:MAG: protein kinase, partial [Xanthomonadales bacterium]|nr:protein kinase [Xanthomonadales bacterium]